ncbi:MAG: GNAT family N-acetyltransferase [Candidatus Korobacteraceae bacterium]
MAVSVREANLIDDSPILTGLARKYLAPDADERRFQWLYRENPFGAARAWIACEKDRKPIGMAAIFPRKMYCDGAVVSACVLGDLCISPEYRSLGPALQLQRACLACARSADFALAYDFPSSTMAGIYRYLGIEPAGKSVRQVKALRAETFARSLHLQRIPRPLAAAVNATLVLRDYQSAKPAGVDFCLQEEPCTSEYSALADKVGASLGTCTIRSAEYLNWRYRRHPQVKYEFLTARRDQKLLAYCTFTESSGTATIAELFGRENDNDVLASLLRKLAALLRARGVATLSLPLLSGDPRNQLLRKFGFWAREAVPVFVLGREAGISSSQMLLMHGDRES